MSDPVLPGEGPMTDAAASIRAYLDADTSSNSFGRLMPYELPDGAPKSLTRTDLIAVLDELDHLRSECAALAAKVDAARALELPDGDWSHYYRMGYTEALAAVGRALDAPGRPHTPAQEAAEVLAKLTASIDAYIRACKATECSCYPVAGNTKVFNHWCRTHGVLSIVPAELTWTNPGIRGGEPCMRGTRVPVEDVSTLLEDGATWDFVKETYPSIPTPEGRREATQEGHSGQETAGTGSGRGTGVAEAPEAAQASEGGTDE